MRDSKKAAPFWWAACFPGYCSPDIFPLVADVLREGRAVVMEWHFCLIMSNWFTTLAACNARRYQENPLGCGR